MPLLDHWDAPELGENWSPAARAAAALARKEYGGGGLFTPTPEVKKFAGSFFASGPAAEKAKLGSPLSTREVAELHVQARNTGHQVAAKHLAAHLAAHPGVYR